MRQLPEKFTAMMRPLAGDALIDALENGEPKRGLRVNTLRLSSEEFKSISPFGLEASPLCPDSFIIGNDEPAGVCAYHDAGLYYLQEPSASSVGEAAGAAPGMRVLDLCAAPGGKSTHIAAKLRGEGILISNECVGSRVKPLRSNLERMGVRNAAITSMMPYDLRKHFMESFDLVLTDAPCSGEGMFRREKNALTEWTYEHALSCAERQTAILEDAAAMTAVGGALVYSTCTLNVYENEMVIDSFLTAHPEFEMEEIEHLSAYSAKPEWCGASHENIRLAARLMPHIVPGEGHFVAKMRKLDSHESVSRQEKSSSRYKQCGKVRLRALTRDENALFSSFWSDNFSSEPWYEPLVYGDNVYLIAPGVRELSIAIAQGVHVGAFKTKRFEPTHSLYMAAEPRTVLRRLELDEDSYRSYVSGSEIECSENGYCAVTVSGYIIGYGKASGGILKNKYPTGLRRSIN